MSRMTAKPVKTAAILGTLCVAGALALATPAQAQATPAQAPAPDLSLSSAPVGKQAGTVMVRLRAIGVLPENSSSSVSIGGHVGTTNTATPELDLSYFFTDNIAAELIAASTQHDVSASTAGGKVDVGSVWVLPPTLTAEYHFFPHERLSPYLGAGISAVFFYDTQPAGPTVTKWGLSNAIGPAIQAGVDYNIAGHWFLNADVKQIFISTKARINGGAITAKTALNPTVVGAGIGYRF